MRRTPYHVKDITHHHLMHLHSSLIDVIDGSTSLLFFNLQEVGDDERTTRLPGSHKIDPHLKKIDSYCWTTTIIGKIMMVTGINATKKADEEDKLVSNLFRRRYEVMSIIPVRLLTIQKK